MIFIVGSVARNTFVWMIVSSFSWVSDESSLIIAHRVFVSSNTSRNAPSHASSFCSNFPPGTSQQPICSLNVAVTIFLSPLFLVLLLARILFLSCLGLLIGTFLSCRILYSSTIE